MFTEGFLHYIFVFVGFLSASLAFCLLLGLAISRRNTAKRLKGLREVSKKDIYQEEEKESSELWRQMAGAVGRPMLSI